MKIPVNPNDLIPFPDRFAEQMSELIEEPSIRIVMPSGQAKFVSAGGIVMLIRPLNVERAPE